MASFLGGIFRTPRSNATRPREESPKDDLSPESVLSSPIAASLLVKNGQTSSLKKLKRKRISTEGPSDFQDEDDSVAPEPKGINAGTSAPEALMSIEDVPEDKPASAKVRRRNPTNTAAARPSDVKQSLPAEKQAHGASNPLGDELWTIAAIKNHRWSDDSIELQIKWDEGDMTWEPEISIQEDAPEALFSYWSMKGGRPPHPSDPDLFHIFAVRKVAPRSQKVLVEWVGYKEQTWEPRSTVEEAAPDMLKEFEARQSRAPKRRRRR